MKEIHRVKVGEEILIDHKLTRGYPTKLKRIYETIPMKETLVYIVGKRTLHNGYVAGDLEEGRFFVSEESIPVWLVVKDLNTKPFYTLRK